MGHLFSEKQIVNILEISKKAGDAILEYYKDYKDLSIVQKEDNSPVTKADLASNSVIIEGLQKSFPDIAIVSEENSEDDNLKAAQNSQYFMIDPLDGTSAFIKKSDEFTVNIALIKNEQPVFGAIYLPVKDILYFTDADNKSYKINNYSVKNSQKELIEVVKKKSDLKVICTNREPEKSQIIEDLKARNISIKEIISIASSYKFCLIAEGKADLYPRKVSIKAWDVAAGHAIVKTSGGKMTDPNNKEITYKSSDNFNISFFEVKA